MLSVDDAAFLARLHPAAPTPYHRRNPLTKATLAIATTLTALIIGGYLVPSLLLIGVILPSAAAAGSVRPVLSRAAALTLPLAVAVALVSAFTRPGSTVLLVLGPFDATVEGVDFAARVIVRLYVMAAAVTLFGLTTPARVLTVDLERRGVSPRLTYAIGAVLDTVPAMVERVRLVVDAQRARGLDTEGNLLRRAAGVVPLVGPVVIGALHGVEARSLALDARAFGRRGPRQLLWAPIDSGWERVARWLLGIALVVLIAGAAAGAIPALP